MGAASAERCEGEHSAPALVLEASRHVAAGDSEAAVAALAEAAALEPNYLPLHFITALMAWRLSDFSKALEVTRACFEREPMNGTVAEVLASLFAQVGDLHESLFHGKLATALKPDDLLQALIPPDFPSFDRTFLAIQDRPLFAHAKHCRAHGEIALALDRGRQHIEIAPEDNEARQFQAELLLRFGMAGAAAETLRPAVVREGVLPSLVSLYARALTDVGDFDEARRWHEKARLAAPRDAEIAAAWIEDSLWLGDDAKEVAAAAAKWAAAFAKPGKPAPRSPPKEKLVIGYIVSDFADPNDAAAVATVARAHDRNGAQVIAYGAGAKAWDENITLGGAFDQWRDIARLDPATIARVFASDGLDLAIDVGGLAAPGNLQALARANSMLRVAWLQSPAGLETIYDAVIANGSESGSPMLSALPVGWGAYPVLRDWAGLERTADRNLRFGADVRLRQLDRETVKLWSAVLSAIPGSVLLLRQNDMASPANISRLVERFGRALASRIDILEAGPPGEFYRHVDIALPPTVGNSPRMVAEALFFGVPALALRSDRPHQPYAVMLEALGLGDQLVATSVQDYVARAKALASSSDTQARIAGEVAAAVAAAEASASKIAGAIEQAARRTLAGPAA
jgi:tetratricopeptide (TPR) repeat protein